MGRNNLGTLINSFDESDGTVESFNEIFTFAPLHYSDIVLPYSKIVILEPTTSSRRLLDINGVMYEHDFVPLSNDFSWDNNNDELVDDWDF
jgi:hypothetical protein